MQNWRELVAEADGTVLRDKRRVDTDKKSPWRLIFVDHTREQGQGTISEISKWIYHDLAKEFSLTVEPTFGKVEVTAEDVTVLLRTLWDRAEDIVCAPERRVAFHAVVLMMAIGGFRRGCVLNILYRQFKVAIVRDPKDRTRTKLVVTILTKRNKKKRAKLGFSSKEMSFSITLIPYSNLCLASLVASVAIKDDAFEPSFKSASELLHRPALEDVDFIPLKWRDDILDKPLFQLSTSEFHRLWHRTCLVSGVRKDPRPYGLRVGAGGRLDGVLSDAMRNYVMSHTTGVFEGSYQTVRTRENLMDLAFGSMAGENSSLFQCLRNISLQRDAGAPIDPTPEDLLDFEKRNDVCEFRACIKGLTGVEDRVMVSSLTSKLRHLISALSSLRVQERREEYFNRVDSLRALGLPTTTGTTSARTSTGGRHVHYLTAAAAVAKFMRNLALAINKGQQTEHHSERYISLVASYLSRQPAVEPGGADGRSVGNGDSGDGDLDGDDDVRKTSDDEPDDADSADRECEVRPSLTVKERPRCLLGCGFFCHRQALTKHCKSVHANSFNQPFPCPECRRLGKQAAWVAEGGPAWSRHVHDVHGKLHAPNLLSHPPPPQEQVRCLICCRHFPRAAGLTRHFRLTHVEKERVFEAPLECPECLRLGREDPPCIDGGLPAWMAHVAAAHCEVDDGGPRAQDSPTTTTDSASPPPAARVKATTGGGRKRKKGDDDLPCLEGSRTPKRAAPG